MNLCIVSDLHGFLPKILPCDVLLIGGDIAPDNTNQLQWLNTIFRDWLLEVPVGRIVACAGNHDLWAEQAPDRIPQGLRWEYLIDQSFQIGKFRGWASPWQRTWPKVDPPIWAFNLSEDDLAKKWESIPKNTDILLLHSPPYQFGDFSIFGHEHAGSPSLARKIEEIQPKLVICGHIHSGYGVYKIGNTTIINGSHMNNDYQPVNKPVTFDLGPSKLSFGVSGDSKITRLDKGVFDFHGTPGKSYLLLESDRLRVTARVRSFNGNLTVLDQVKIQTDAHSVVCDNSKVLIDGKSPLERHRRPGDWVWSQREDRLVAVGHAGWLISVFRDSGDEAIHQTGSLRGVEHLAVFGDAPGNGVPPGARGLVISGFDGCNLQDYQIHES